MGEALGSAGVSVEGGGAFLFNGEGIAHFYSKTQLLPAKLSKRRESQCSQIERFLFKN